MSGLWHRTLVYLGLKEEPEEGYDELPERFTADDAQAAERTSAYASTYGDEGVVRPLRSGEVHVRAVPSGPVTRVTVVEVREFEDVEAVGARYRAGQAVLFDVSAAGTATGRRVVDFVSGLTYLSRGSLSKVGTRAFLLVPDGTEVAEDELARLSSLGYRLPTRSNA